MTIKTSIATGKTKGEGITTREERGIALAQEHFEEIVKVRPWTLSVSSSDGSKAYEVNLKHETCSCPDAVNRPKGEACKHVFAVRWVKANTSGCAGCGVRFLHRDLIEVGSEVATFGHDAWEGDHYCRPCARRVGVL